MTTPPSVWEEVGFGGVVTRWAVYDIANLTSGGLKFDINVHTSIGK